MGKPLKMIIVLIVALVVLGGFATVGNFNSSKKVDKTKSETWHIHGTFIINQNTTDPLTGKKGQFGFDSNVIVESDGTLIVENATMYFLSDIAHHYRLLVNGSMILYNSTLTIGTGLIQPYYSLDVNINGQLNPSAEVRIEKSQVLYSGWFNVTNKNESIVIEDSVFDEMNGGTYGPTPYLLNSVIVMENTSFNHLFEHDSSGMLPIGNMTDSSTYTSSTSDVLVNNFVKNVYPGYSKWWSLVPIKELDMDFDYSTSGTYDNTSQIQIMYYNTPIMNFTFKRTTSTTFITIPNPDFEKMDLTANNLWDDYNSGAIKVVITPAHTGTVTVKNVALKFFIERNVVLYGIEKFDFNLNQTTIYGKDLYIGADFQLGYGTTHNRISLYGGSYLYVLNLTVESGATKEDSCIFANDFSSQAYLLRYGNIKVSFHGYPIDGLYVNATPYTVDSTMEGTIINVIQTYINHIHYGHINGNVIWDKTVNGEVYLPLLSDIVNKNEWPNSQYVGIYNITVNNQTQTLYHAQIGLDYFPWLLVQNNTLVYNAALSQYKDIDIGVSMTILSSSPYITGRSISVLVNVENYGTEIANSVYIYLYVNGNVVNQTYLPTMDPSEMITENYVIPGTILSSDGEYNISAMSIQEWDYNSGNNVSYEIIKVGRLDVTQWNVEQPLVNGHNANISISLDSYYSYLSSTAYLYMDSPTIPIKTWSGIVSGSNLLQVNWNVNGTAGDHNLLLYVDSTLVSSYKVHIYRDVDISIEAITVNPSEIYVYEDTTITVNLMNNGGDTPVSTVINIKVLDPYNGKVVDENVSYNSTITINLRPMISGYYSVEVSVLGDEDYNPSNNYMTQTFVVNPSPFSVSAGQYTVINGTNVKIDISLRSEIGASVNLKLSVPVLNLNLTPSNIQNPATISAHGTVMAEFVITPSQYASLLNTGTNINVMYFLDVVSNRTGLDNTLGFGPYYFNLKEKPDFQVIQGSLVIEENDKIYNSGKVAEGVIVTIRFTVENTGGTTENVSYSLKDTYGGKNVSITTGYLTSVGPGTSVNVSYNYTIGNIGNHVITVTLNPARNVTEKKYTNNYADVDVTVTVPVMDIHYSVASKEHNDKLYEGDHIIVTVLVINKNATESQGKNVPMSGVKVTVNLGALGSYTATTQSNGVATIKFIARKTGKYSPTITGEYGGVQQTFSFSHDVYTVSQKPFEIPWLWIIIAAIGVAIAVFFLYGYVSFKKEAKEYMICGNCGRLIPADSERCPYCGAVFEKEKVKCPECGSWIDEDSKYCPICGTVFIGPEDANYDKFVSLKDRYDQYLAKYKEEAKKYIGEEYSTEEFFKWWKTHPEYISFLEWIKRQEEEIEGETVKCPVCGALNPKGAKICRVCGSPLPQPEEEEEKEEKKEEEKGGKEEKGIMEQYREEYAKIEHPGVVSFEEWVKRKRKEEVIPKEETVEVERKAAPPSTDKTKVKEKEKEGYIKCPVCGALNPPDAKTCAVCGAPLTSPPPSEEEEVKKAPAKPIVKRKVIKKVIAVNKEEEKK